MIIDAHQHFWKIGHHDCTWPPVQLAAIHRDFTPQDLEPIASDLRVDSTVLVQSQPSDIDTNFLLSTADRCPLVGAIVAWVDLLDAGAPDRIAELAAHPKVRGIRPMLQSLPADWILAPALEPAIAALIEHGLRFDALVLPRHLRSLEIFVRRYPDLPVVIDHAAKPDIRRGVLDPWREQIGALAAVPHVCCKFSGLLTEANPQWRVEEVQPYVDHLLASFGSRRLMWGSDWPVVNLACDYPEWLAVARRLCGETGHDDLDNLFHGTAQRFYDIPLTNDCS